MDRQNFEILIFFINNDALTLRELQTHFSISRVTATKNIKEINDYLEGIAEIKVNQAKYYLAIEDYSALAKVQTNFLKEDLDFNDPAKRQAAILKKLLKSTQDYIVVDDLADDLSVSHGTITKDINKLRKILGFYDATIQTKTNRGIRLKATHLYSYAVIMRNLVSPYYELAADWSAVMDSKLTTMIKQIDSNDETVAMIKRNVVVIESLRADEIKIYQPTRNYSSLIAKTKTQELREFITEVTGEALSAGEWDYISYPLNIKQLPVDDEALIRSALDEIEKLMRVIFPRIKKEFDIHLNFERLFVQLKYHLLFLINRAIFSVNSPEFISADVLNKYPVATELATRTLKALEHRLGIQIRSQEIGYLTVYFQMELEEYMAAPIIHRIALVRPISNSMRRFITEQLKELLNGNLQIDVFNSEKDLKESNEKYLLIFSNNPLSSNGLVGNVPIIKLNSVFNQGTLKERLQISLVDEAIKQGQCRFEVTKLSGEQSYTESVKMLIQKEIAVGQLKKEFLTDWMKREKLASNIFGDGVALPHVIDQSGLNRILVTVGIFRRPVTYDSQKVNVVFLVAIPYKLDADLSRTLSQVYDLIRSIVTNSNIFNNLKNYEDSRGLTQLMEAL